MKKILVVDDIAFSRLSVKTLLEKSGFQVVGESKNGTTAIEMYKKLKPEIVAIDMTMPGMDGIETLNEIIKFDSKAKIIMLSSIGQETKIKKAVILGAKDFIVKPFMDDYLVKAVANL